MRVLIGFCNLARRATRVLHWMYDISMFHGSDGQLQTVLSSGKGDFESGAATRRNIVPLMGDGVEDSKGMPKEFFDDSE